MTDAQRALLERLDRTAPPPPPVSGPPRCAGCRGVGWSGSSERSAVARPPSLLAADAARDAPDLTADQRSAVGEALAAFEADAPGREFVLHGVTGSGKTEVYLALAQASLDRGRGVIILVPEIALTPQTLTRFTARFGDVVAVLHSGLTDGARHDEWLRSRGDRRVSPSARGRPCSPRCTRSA